MRAILQRVTQARVRIGDRVAGEIGRGVVVLAGVGRDDTPDDIAYVAAKIRDIRIFEGTDGKPMDRSLVEVGGAALIVSQFTLYGDVRKGRRPSFDGAAPPPTARELYDRLVSTVRASGLAVATGEFQTTMQVELTNDGPVTILIDSRR